MKNKELYKIICKRAMNNAFKEIQQLTTNLAATEINEKVWNSIDELIHIMEEYDNSLYKND